MNTTAPKIDEKVTIVEAYYRAMLSQDFDLMESYLHPNVNLISPLAQLSRKEEVADSARGLAKICQKIDFRVTFSSESQVMLAYDFSCVEPIGSFRAAALIEISDGLISSIELFFDARRFVA